jgi:hypothetical protein
MWSKATANYAQNSLNTHNKQFTLLCPDTLRVIYLALISHIKMLTGTLKGVQFRCLLSKKINTSTAP